MCVYVCVCVCVCAHVYKFQFWLKFAYILVWSNYCVKKNFANNLNDAWTQQFGLKILLISCCKGAMLGGHRAANH